jgi:hypothetical protein
MQTGNTMPEIQLEPLGWNDILDLAEYMESIRADIKVTFASSATTDVTTVDELYELMMLYGKEFSTIRWERDNDEILVDVPFRSLLMKTKFVNLVKQVRDCINGLGYRAMTVEMQIT